MPADIDILDAVDVPIIVVSRDRAVMRFNQAAAETLGATPPDIGRPWSDMQALASVEQLETLCVQAMVDGVPSRCEARYGDRWFLLRVAPYRDSGGPVRGAVLTFTNFTAFRASLQKAIYEREYTKSILNSALDPLVVLDEDLRIQTANRAFFDWFAASRDHIQGALLSSFGDHDWQTSGLWPSLKAALSHHHEFTTVELERHFQGVGHRTALLDAQRIVRDGTPLLLVSFRDITARKQAEQALRESEKRFRTLFESMDEGYCVIEVIFDENTHPIDYRFLDVNPAFEQQTGIANACGQRMRQIAPTHEQHWFDIYGRVALTGETVRFENPAAALHRHYEVCAFRIGDPQLRRVGIIFNDITARKNMERQRQRLLEREEALRKDAEAAVRTKDRFLATLSHELRTPLSPIAMMAAVMERDADLPVRLRNSVAMIRRNVELETRLIDDLLDLNRVTSGKMHLNLQVSHIHDVLVQAVQTCAADLSAKKLNIQVDLGAEHDLANVDPARLQQVVWNLLRNSAKFTPEGGSVSIRTESSAGRVRVAVRDTGVGIEPELLPKVFDAFEQGEERITRQYGGLGLGLAICKAIMDLHRGTIRALSDGPGKGATFIIELPAVFGTTRQAAVAAEGPPAPAIQDLRVLLVEDHPDTRDVLATLLGKSIAAIETAGSVAAALQLAAARQFDIVVSDLGLPDGSGYDLMKQLRARHGIKGIALSAYGMEADQQRSREAGFLDHVVKPVDIKQLLEVIQRTITAEIGG